VRLSNECPPRKQGGWSPGENLVDEGAAAIHEPRLIVGAKIQGLAQYRSC
jgi:hypothetical protein